MWRSLFLAIGITLIILGLQCLVVESVEIRSISRAESSAPTSASPFQTALFSPVSQPVRRTTVYRPKEWMPWSLLAVGTIVVIYTYSLPRRVGAH